MKETEPEKRRSGETGKPVTHFRDLDVYQNALTAGLRIYELSKKFPAEERYALIDQIRRSSRSVCANVASGEHSLKSQARARSNPPAIAAPLMQAMTGCGNV